MIKGKIVVIEDSKAVGLSIKMFLEKNGYQLHFSADFIEFPDIIPS